MTQSSHINIRINVCFHIVFLYRFIENVLNSRIKKEERKAVKQIDYFFFYLTYWQRNDELIARDNVIDIRKQNIY